MVQNKSLLLRVSQELIDRVDAHVLTLQARHQGLLVTRSSTMRQLVLEGLARAEEGALQSSPTEDKPRLAPLAPPTQASQPSTKALDVASRTTRLDRVFSRLAWVRKYKSEPDSYVVSWREDEADEAGAWTRRHSETTRRVVRSAYLYLDTEGQVLAVSEQRR